MPRSHCAGSLGRAGRREQQPAARKIDYMLYWIEKFYEMTKKKKNLKSRVGRCVNSCCLVDPQPLLQKHPQVSATTSSSSPDPAGPAPGGPCP